MSIALMMVSSSWAYTPGTVGFQFLKTQVGARAAGLAGAFVAFPNDVSSLHYNPAGVATFSNRAASFTYFDELLDFNTGFIGFVQPKIGPGNLGASVLYKDYGEFDKTDETGKLGSFRASSVAFVASYGVSIYKNLYVGGSAKYIHSAIDNFSSDAAAVDLGALFFIPAQELYLAAAVTNAGKATSAFVVTKDPLPLQARFGISKKLAHLPLLIGVNAYKYVDQDWLGAIGGEFTLMPNLFLRLGYDLVGRDLKVGSSKDRLAGAAIGLGIVWNGIMVDYALSSFGELGSLNRFTLSGQF